MPLASLDDVENFRPEDVPTVGVLLRELEGLKLNSGNIADGWERTSLKKYVDVFDRHCEGLLRETRETKKGQSSFGMSVGVDANARWQRVLRGLWNSDFALYHLFGYLASPGFVSGLYSAVHLSDDSFLDANG